MAKIRKVAAHLGNWWDGVNSALDETLTRIRPIAVHSLDNTKPSTINQILTRPGVLYYVYRPYYNPAGQGSGASVEEYIGQARAFLRECLNYPNIVKVMNEGRFWVKLFNETNIGYEGFPDGNEGFDLSITRFMQAHGPLKVEFPKVKFASCPPTPGHHDAYFTGDDLNEHYYFHGPEAAKANPSASEIQAAIRSCKMRPMFEACDGIGLHVYGAIEKHITGSDAPWFAKRHHQYMKFTDGYNKPYLILEADFGMKEPPQKRADLCVWVYQNIIDPDPRILFLTHWLVTGWGDADPAFADNFFWDGGGEHPRIMLEDVLDPDARHYERPREEPPRLGPPPQEIEEARGAGVTLRPIVYALEAYQGVEGGTPPPPIDPPPPPPPVPPPPPAVREVINKPAWVTIHDATNVPAGADYWFLYKFRFLNENESGGRHHIDIMEPHSPNERVRVINTGNSADGPFSLPLNKPAGEPAQNHPMYGVGNEYLVYMEGPLSDWITGLRMEGNRHVVYQLWFRKQRKEGGTPPPVSGLAAAIWARVAELEAAGKTIRLNPNAALQKKILATFPPGTQGFTVTSEEFTVSHQGSSYTCQRAERLSDGKVRAYYAKTGDWSNVLYVERA